MTELLCIERIAFWTQALASSAGNEQDEETCTRMVTLWQDRLQQVQGGN